MDQSSKPETGTVTVWSWNVAAKSLRAIVRDFRRQHSAVDVAIEMNGTSVQSRFLLALVTGTGSPDVMQLQGYEAPRYLATGRLADLTAVAAKYERAFPASAWANCVKDGRIYAIPWDLGPCAVFYKPDLFERYGVDPGRIETWEDFIAAGRQIVERSGGRTKMLPLGRNSIQPMHEMLIQQLGGQVFDADGRIVVDSPASRRATDLIARMLDAGICANVDLFKPEWMAGLSADTIACYPGAVWLGGTIKDTAGEVAADRGPAWRVFRLPAFDPGGPHVSNLGGSVLVIPDQSPHKAAAWAFIEFALCTRASQVAHYANFDLFPAFLPALDDPFFEQPDPFYGGQKVRALFADGVDCLPVLHRTADWVDAATYLNQGFTAWASGRADTGTMLDRLGAKLARRLNRERAAADGQVAVGGQEQ